MSSENLEYIKHTISSQVYTINSGEISSKTNTKC